jgi:myo-inositol-1(or 4)-monophosphatase
MALPSHNSDDDEALGAAVRAARRGAEIIREHAGRLDDVRAKGINDFVTATDEAAQDAIVETLREGSDATIIAEEGADLDAHSTTADGRRWIVDPLDGTTNFMQQVPPYAVSVALQETDRIVVGVVLDITHDELFTAVAGHGLQLNGQSVGVTQTEDFSDAFVATGFPYRRFEHTEQYLAVLERVIRNTRGVRRHGSAAVDLARLACGRFDGFFETGLRPWDVAAGTLLVREGGGRITDYRNTGGLAPLFDQQVCATNGLLHDSLLDCVASMKDVRL